MSVFSFSSATNTHYESLCEKNGAFFATKDWQSLLQESFRCRTIYGTSSGSGLAISVFKAGPFDVGYVGFPAGIVVGSREELGQALEDFKVSDDIDIPVCLRIPLSALSYSQELDLPYITNPETVIADLQSWDSTAVSKKLRRDIRKAQGFDFDVVDSCESSLGESIYQLYEDTVRRHRGSLRYSPEYFTELINLSRTNERLRVFLARKDDQLAGFAATARDEVTTYYLHGGTNEEFRKQSPSDLLLLKAINCARDDGCQIFNLMASPTDQPMLVRYKEKWGGTTRELRTHTLALGRAYPLFAIAERLYRFVR